MRQTISTRPRGDPRSGFFAAKSFDILRDMEKLIYLPFLEKESSLALSESEKEMYTHLVLRAKEAKAYPHQSGYFVQTAGLAEDGTEYVGGNKEYGFSDAFVHGETAVISGMKDITDSPIKAIAWYRKEGELVTHESFGRPCGNCRDVMNAYCTPDLVLLNGNETGIVFTQLKDFLFEDFGLIDSSRIDGRGIEEALSAADAGIDTYLPETTKLGMYGAALVAEDGTVWSGTHYSNAGYDSVTPVMSAVLHWMNDYPKRRVSERHLKLSKLVVAGGWKMVSPLYRDRQAILELDEILRRYNGNDEPLRVEIVRFDDKVKVFVTDTDEWLPHPFSPGAFRMDDVMEAQLVKLIGETEVKKIIARRSLVKLRE